MKLPNWVKIIWWVLLVVIISTFLYKRMDSIIKGQASAFDIFAFVIWICFLLVPLFQEIEIFGIKLKQQIEDVKEKIVDLKNEIHNSINVRTQFNPQIYMTPPPDSQLPVIEQRLITILEEARRNLGIPEQNISSQIPEISHNIKTLFNARYHIERELRRIWRDRFDGEKRNRPVQISQIIGTLVESQLIDSRLASVIREVYSICSPAIHGEDISERQVAFVRDIAPGLIETLRAIH